MTPERKGKAPDDFWDALGGDHALDPNLVGILEALRWIGEPLSAVGVVDLLDGQVTMWEAAHHLGSLEALGVLKARPDAQDTFARHDAFALPYGLTESSEGEDG
jgi:hypothetical protein